ncbi:MAG: Selenocysteine-specific translation elongation factor [Myxococcaceae bacterium]|nr:Selenocysteine-specific translation elongation factor [Myxococcaceae bacterium]
MRHVIGTAGHVDHGKTTLVRALTGVSTDRLPEEKRRGISIELGFAPWTIADGLEASVVDVPGHRRLVHAMIAGASGIELVLIAVAADEGVMPQTREHVAVCELLGITEAVVALTKVDRVDAETRAMAEAEVRELLDGRLACEVVACAAPTGLGMRELGEAVARRLRATTGRAREDAAARLWVDRVIHVKGAGTVVTGTLVTGTMARGDELALVGERGVRRVVARELHVHGHRVERAVSATRLAVNLPIDAGDVARGDLLVAEEAAPAPTSVVDALFRGDRPKRGASFSLHVGTSHVPATVTRVEPAKDGAHLVRLRLARPRPLSGGDRYVLRGSAFDAPSGALAGGGIVLDARPHARSRGPRRRALAEAVVAGDAGAIVAALVAESEPRPLEPAAVDRARLPIPREAIATAADRAVADGPLARCGTGVVERRVIAALADEARALVAEHAARAPLDRGMPLATLRQRIASRAGHAAAETAILAARARRGPDDVGAIAIDGDVAFVAIHRGRTTPELAGALARAAASLRDAGVHGASLARVVDATGTTPDRARAVLAALERSGGAVHAGDLWFDRAVVDHVRACAVEHLQRAAGVSVIELKHLCGLPRRQAILLLEHFDVAGLTRRTGDVRVLVGGPAAESRPAGSR